MKPDIRNVLKRVIAESRRSSERGINGVDDDLLVQQARLAEAFSVLAKPVSRLLITNTVDHALRRIYGWPDEMRDPSESHRAEGDQGGRDQVRNDPSS